MPDRECAEYLLRGLREGFRTGFEGKGVSWSARRNISSAEQSPNVVQKYLAKKKALGRVNVVNPEDCGPIHINCFGVIPKKHQSGKWRLIVDLSHLRGASINDGVDPQLCSLSYTSVEAAATKVLEVRPLWECGCWEVPLLGHQCLPFTSFS